MSLMPQKLEDIPAETAQVARAAFPKGNLYMRVRDQLGPLYQDEAFAQLFPPRGRPVESPGRLALVMVFQFAEGLSDRAAADAVRSRIDWKYVLGLALTDSGFDASVLTDFRARLVQSDEAIKLFETLLQKLKEAGFLKAGGRQRTDSTHVLAAVHTLNRLECIGEAMRYALNALATVDPEWIRAQAPPEWYERYDKRPTDFDLSKEERRVFAEQIGRDGYALLDAIEAVTAPAYLRPLPAIRILRGIWMQQFYREGERVRWREADNIPPASLMIYSPYDPDARLGKKRETTWQGYKVHLTETCEPDGPHLITDVQTTVAPRTDKEVIPDIHDHLARRALLPEEQLVDAGYVIAENLVDSQSKHGIRLVGPVIEDHSWQAKAGKGFDAASFVIDWEQKKATCPQGKTSATWQESQASYGMDIVYIHFLKSVCSVCPVREECTQTKSQRRTITVNARPYHEALQAARARQETEAFKDEYKTRAGIEGTISQGVHVAGIRRARYKGLAKTRLQHLATAAALNVLRLGAWLLERPRAKTRTSAFMALAPKAA